MLSDLDLPRYHRFYEEQRQPSSGSAWPVCAKKEEIGPPLLGAGRFDTICTVVCDRTTACRLCRLEPTDIVMGFNQSKLQIERFA